MTVSASKGRQFTIGQIISQSYKFAGLLELSQEPDAAKVAFAKQMLEGVLDDLEAVHGAFARVVDFYLLTLTANAYIYSLPAYVLDLIGDGMFMTASETDTSKASSESPVIMMPREDWHRIPSKSTTGQPSRYYPHRVADTVEVRLWPIPDETNSKIRFQYNRKLSDADDANATLDLENWWLEYVKAELGYELAESASMPNDKVVRLASRARAKLEMAKGKANQRGPQQIYMDHRTNY